MQIPAPVKDLAALYEQAAERALSDLRAAERRFPVEIDGVTQEGAIELFWTPYRPGTPAESIGFGPFSLWSIQGFGRFGPLGAHFGDTEVREPNGPLYRIDASVYRDLAIRFVASAIADTLRAFNHPSRWTWR